jgi:signal transduction histidine kinase
MRDKISIKDVLALPVNGPPRPGPEEAMDVSKKVQSRLAQLLPALGIINVVNCIVTSACVLGQAPIHSILIWVVPLLIASVMQCLKGRQFRHSAPPTTVTGNFVVRASRHSFVIGALWGSAAFWLWTDDLALNYLILGVLAGMSAGVSGMMTSVALASSRFVAGCAVIVVVCLVLRSPEHWTATAFMWTILVGALFYGSLVGHRNMVREVEERVSSDRTRGLLQDMIDASADAMALFDSRGRKVVSNRAHTAWFKQLELVDIQKFQIDGEKISQFDGTSLLRTTSQTCSGLTVLIHRDETDLIRLRDSIERQSEELDSAQRGLDRLLDNVRSEIREPMINVQRFIKVLGPNPRAPFDSRKAMELTGLIDACATKATLMLDDLLLAARVRQEEAIVIDACNAGELLQSAFDPSRAPESSLWSGTLRYHVPESPVPLYVDKLLLNRLLQTCLSFCHSSYSGSEDRVARLTVRDDQAIFSFEDSGPNPTDADRTAGAFMVGFTQERSVTWSVAVSLAKTVGATLHYRHTANSPRLVYLIFPMQSLHAKVTPHAAPPAAWNIFA